MQLMLLVVAVILKLVDFEVVLCLELHLVLVLGCCWYGLTLELEPYSSSSVLLCFFLPS